jgi:hypothetical protein
MILLKKSTTPETYDIIMNSLLMRAKLKWFVAADIVCEQEVRISKEVYKARGGHLGGTTSYGILLSLQARYMWHS